MRVRLTLDLFLHFELEDGFEERDLGERELAPQHERQHLLLLNIFVAKRK